MRITISSVGIAVLAWGILAPQAHAQRGMGEQSGVARQAVKPEVVSFSGKVLEVKIEPCKMTTGRAYLGTHFILQTPEGGALNIHLGPPVAVDFATKELSVDAKVTVKAFRTTKMPENHYTAQSLVLDNTTIQLRDESLRPVWAGGGKVVPARPGPQWPRGVGRGQGRGYGSGYDRGRSQGRGYGWSQGRGYGWGQGRGYGWGRGSGAGRGAGFGRGWAFVDEDGDGVRDNYGRLWRER